jgi:hypothetical protein
MKLKSGFTIGLGSRRDMQTAAKTRPAPIDFVYYGTDFTHAWHTVCKGEIVQTFRGAYASSQSRAHAVRLAKQLEGMGVLQVLVIRIGLSPVPTIDGMPLVTYGPLGGEYCVASGNELIEGIFHSLQDAKAAAESMAGGIFHSLQDAKAAAESMAGEHLVRRAVYI